MSTANPVVNSLSTCVSVPDGATAKPKTEFPPLVLFAYSSVPLRVVVRRVLNEPVGFASTCVTLLAPALKLKVRTSLVPLSAVCVTATVELLSHCTSSGESGTVVVTRGVSVASEFTSKTRSSSTVVEAVPFATASQRPFGESETVCGPSPEGVAATKFSEPFGLTVNDETESPTLFVTNTAGAADCPNAIDDIAAAAAENATARASFRVRCMPHLPEL